MEDDKKARMYLANALDWALNVLEGARIEESPRLAAAREILSRCKPEAHEDWWKIWQEDRSARYSGKSGKLGAGL